MFVQRVLSAEQLSKGLHVLADPVYIPDEPLALLTLTAQELEQRVPLTFQESFDDLDDELFAVVQLSDCSSITLILFILG